MHAFLVMRTGTRSLRRTSLAVPLGVLGGTALLATALVWGRRRSWRERPQRGVTPNEGSAKPTELESTQLTDEAKSLQVLETESRQLSEDAEGELDARVGSASLAGESYDSVNPGALSPAQLEDAGMDVQMERPVSVPPGFFHEQEDLHADLQEEEVVDIKEEIDLQDEKYLRRY